MTLFFLFCSFCFIVSVRLCFLRVVSFWLFVFFFFKQKTAYEMRISAWSSDVCSSDLVREEGDWRRVVAGILARHGRLDVLVNNAGITGFEAGMAAHDPEHATLEDWRAVHATNLDGTFLGCKHAIGAMRPAGAGSIINISSRSGLVGIPAAAAYASSKAAIRNHTKSVALWCASQGLAIRCTFIHPAAILTPIWEAIIGAVPDREGRMAALGQDTPLRSEERRVGKEWDS